MRKSGKPVLVVDIDEVMGLTWRGIVEAYQQTHGGNPTYYSFEGWGVPGDEAIRRIEKLIEVKNLHIVPPMPDAQKVLKQLHERYKLAVVTGRNPTFEGETRSWLDTHFTGMFDEIIFTHYFRPDKQKMTKAVACRQLNAVCLIDDHPGHIFDTIGANPTMQGILFGDYPWQGRYDLVTLPQGVRRAADWQQVAEALL